MPHHPSGRRRRRTTIAAGALLAMAVLVVIGAGRPASAQPALVEDLIREGVALRKGGKDHLALPLFQRAYDIEPSARTAAQLGLVEAAMGYWLAAERHLSEGLSSTRHPWVARNEVQIRRTLKDVQASIAEVEITGSPVGAEVKVNGQPAGRLPLAGPVRVPDGMAHVTLSAPGYVEAATSRVVAGGKRVQVNLALTRATAATAARAGEPAPILPVPDRGSSFTADAAEPPPPATNRAPAWVRPVSWFVGAAAVGALGVGLYGVNLQRKRVSEFDQHRPAGATSPVCNTTAADKGGATCRSLHTRIQSSERLAMGGFVTGGVLAIAAVAGFIYSWPSGESSGAGLSWSLQPGDPAAAVPLRLGLAVSF